jgi:type VII secretion-associated serine protease mycosin
VFDRVGPWLAAAWLVLVPAGQAAAPARYLDRPVWTAVTAQATTCGPVVPQPLAEPVWALSRLRPDLAWPLTRGAGVIVAVIDSGVSATAPTLAGKVLPGRDFVDPGSGSGQCDENGHGTLVAGIIASQETVSGDYRYSGIAPDAQILPIRVLRDQQRSTEGDLPSKIAEAIRWAVDEGHAKVVNLSLTTEPTTDLRDAIDHALATGATVVAAAGNDGGTGSGGTQTDYPAAYPGVIAVAGVDMADAHVDSSSTGPYVDIAAPGARIAGPAPRGGGFLFSAEGGTSFAAAYVSGVAALVEAYQPNLTPAQVAQRITLTADHPAGLRNDQVGYGVVNPVRAVGALAVAAPAATSPVAGQIRLPARAPAPHSTVARVAAWLAVSGGLVTVVVLAAVPIVRRGRQRSWRATG